MKDIYYTNERALMEIAEELFPGKRIFSIKEVAAILGVSPSTIYHNKKAYPFGKRTTLPAIVKAVSR